MSRSPSPFEVAAAFCREVGVSDLLTWLELPPDATPEEARARLGERRRRLQGQQGHPTRRHEARAFIARYAALTEALQSVAAYRADLERRARTAHLPVLEMTIRSVLAKGRLSPDDSDYLLRNALELGVTEAEHRALLSRIAGEMGVRIALGPASEGDVAEVPTGEPARARRRAPTPVPPSRPAEELAKPPPRWALVASGVVVVLGAIALGLAALR